MAGRDRRDDDTAWPRQLLLGVAALVAVALVIGGVVSVVALGAARLAGVGADQPTPTSKPSLYIPSGKPSVSPEPYATLSGSAGASPSPSRSPSASASPRHTRKPRPVSLHASPLQVQPGQRINLTGAYRGGAGATLQVQRFEAGHWTDFPVTVPVHGASFATYITTSRTGKNRFRVLDKGAGRASNAVTVQVG
jgi:hypothetical protein